MTMYITIKDSDENRLRGLRRRAEQVGLRVSRSRRWRYQTIDNYGGVALIDTYSNTVVAGDRFSLDLDDAEDFINRRTRSKAAVA